MLLDVLANFLPIAIGLLVLMVLLMILVAAFKNNAVAAPYEKRGPLLSEAEQFFYKHLLQAIPAGTILFSKVRMADVLAVQKGRNKSEWQAAFNKISGKHFDFVLCDSSNFEVQAVVELDDKSHNSGKAKAKDVFINTACSSALIPMIRIKASSTYEVSMLRDKIKVVSVKTRAT